MTLPKWASSKRCVPPAPGILPAEQAALSLAEPQEAGINLWLELKAMLATTGSWHLVRRYTSEQKCSCRRERANDEASPSCPICSGRGWPFREFPVLLYSMGQVAAGASPELKGTLFNLAEEDLVFFAPPESQIATSDLIYEVALTPDQKIAQPIRRLSCFNVGRVMPMRADRNGAVDFLMVLGSEEEGKKS